MAAPTPEAVIARRAAAALGADRRGRCAPTARAWIDALTARPAPRRTPHVPALTHCVRLASAILAVGALSPTTTPPAQAAATTISPGDRIDIDSDSCTQENSAIRRWSPLPAGRLNRR